MQQLEDGLAELEAARLWQQAAEHGGIRVVKWIFELNEGKKAKFVAHALGKRMGTIALLGVKGAPSLLFFGQTAGGKANLADVMNRRWINSGAGGGGTRDFAQGGGVPEADLEAALHFAASRLP